MRKLSEKYQKNENLSKFHDFYVDYFLHHILYIQFSFQYALLLFHINSLLKLEYIFSYTFH